MASPKTIARLEKKVQYLESQLAKSRDERAQALEALTDCCRWFDEGLDARDMAQARELLQTLG